MIHPARLLPALLLGLSAAAFAAEPAVIPVWPKRAPGDLEQSEKVVERSKEKDRPDRSIREVRWPTLTVHLPEPEKATGAAVVICPGGGYGGLAIDKEGHDVARWLSSIGVAGLVLKYRMPAPRLARDEDPWPVQDAKQAIRLVRSRAAEWRLDPGRIGIMGFSAGGHLASVAGTRFDSGWVGSTDPVDACSSRPDFLVLVYPVVSLVEPFTHTGSRDNLLGKGAAAELLEKYSSERQVTAQTPPAFLVHAKDDGVKAENSLAFAEALKKAGVPCTLQLYDKGGHGFGLGIHGGEVAQWPARCAEWMKELKRAR